MIFPHVPALSPSLLVSYSIEWDYVAPDSGVQNIARKRDGATVGRVNWRLLVSDVSLTAVKQHISN
jgi:hypothetical protein